MASLQATADSIRAAVSSTSTCTPTTATILSDLLLPKSNAPDIIVSTNSKKAPKSGASSKAKPTTAASRSRGKKVVVHEDVLDHGNQLSPKERSILATEVINATLKTLSEAIKAPAQAPVRRQPSSKDLVKATARKTLRRSNSLPQSPLQPRSLNRVSSSPSISNRHGRSSSSTSLTSSGYRSTAECARVAFACLRTLQASKTPGADLPPLQLENGMSVLIGKLISLELDDLAIKEVRILKRRLDSEDSQPAQKKGEAVSKENTAPVALPKLGELLEFGKGAFSGAKLGLVITTQLHILRLMTSSRKHKDTEIALSILTPSHPSSPTRLILLAAKESKQSEKQARQLQTLSDILLSLSPSVSPADDAVALEPRLSVIPEAAIQLQMLALHNRILWWGLAGHKRDLAKDLFDPFLRSLSAFSRRSRCGAVESYRIASSAFTELQTLLKDCNDCKAHGPRLVLIGIYRVLSSLALDADVVEDAISWTEKVHAFLDPKVDSEAKQSSVVSRLVALNLRKGTNSPKDEELLLTLLEALERPFKGDLSEICDLITEVSFARRAAVTVLAKRKTAASSKSSEDMTHGIYQMCESLVFLCPRLSLRYLGSSPDVNSTTKDLVNYEQRRIFVTRSGLHAIDSALFLVKVLLGQERLTWDLMDSKFQDCLLLLDRLDANPKEASLDDGISPPSHYVRISNLYYTQFLNMRRDCENTKDGQQIRALRRSIDCVKLRPQHERKAAAFSTKLEKLAECYKATSRFDDLFKTLLSLRDEMICDGVLSAVAMISASQPLQEAWTHDEAASALARTLHSLFKVQWKYLNSGAQFSLVDESWSTEEKGTVLEHQLELLLAANQSSSSDSALDIQTKIFRKLLSIYDKTQYPIRRLRFLIRFLSIDVARSEELTANIQEEFDPAQLNNLAAEDTKDENLQQYLVYFKTMATTLLELQKSQPSIEVLKQGLSAWSSIREKCTDLNLLQQQIEDVKDLLAHLQCLADFLQMRGFDAVRVAVLRLITDFNEICGDACTPDDRVLGFIRLGIQWLHLGYSGKAGLALDRAQSYSRQNGVTVQALQQLHLSYAEYLLTIGTCYKSEEFLHIAQAAYSLEQENMPESKETTLQERTKQNYLISDAYRVYSMLALQRGAAQTALTHAKQSVRLLRRAWTNTEEQFRSKRSSTESQIQTDADKLTEEITHLSLSTITVPVQAMTQQSLSGSGIWRLVTPMFRGLSYLSGLYAHHGMFQETIYYADQAYKLVKEIGSEAHLAMASALLGSTWLKAGALDKGSEFLMGARKIGASCIKSREAVLIACHLGNLHGLLGDRDSEFAAYQDAEQTLKSITGSDFINALDRIVDPSDALEEKMSQLTIAKRKATGSRKASTRPKGAVKCKAANARSQSPLDVTTSITEECPELMSLKATVLRQKARSLIIMKKCVEALGLLNEADSYTSKQIDLIDQGLTMAKQLLVQSIEQMDADPVYSVLPESTISFPSVVGVSKPDRSSGDRLSVSRTSPPRKTQGAKAGRDLAGSKSPAPDSFFEKLRQAQEYLTEVHSMAVLVAPVAVIHKTCALLNSVAILFSAAGQVKGKTLTHPGFASCTIETARTIALRRELKAIQADPHIKLQLDDSCWPSLISSDPRRSSMGFPSDMSRFQRDHIDIIPKSWTAISISLSDSCNELSITKLQAGHSPFVLRLPLGRNNSIDADEEVFGFEQGHSELLEIIDLANESAHDARDMKGREARTAWWEEREALDARLRDLLENIEKVWLGGFTGIFSQHARRPDLLARFQKSFTNILDKHLPSRQKTGKRSASPRITLDSRILDLFIGLGDASDETCDFSDPLTDLLYFVVDVLQFHGELNAYAEIDFDSIVVETHDALRCYHEAVRSLSRSDEGRHTILILDKALHSFPWESLPCMEGLAVSRLPSLGCLRDRIIEEQNDIPDDAPHGQYISRDNGAYILNPSGDLKSTQTTFQKSLQGLDNWHGIIKREPSEDEIKESLASKDLLLYFGHGSGAQYIRAREIRKLDKCAVTMLMGCSSGALTEVGEFEPYGPPINYMHAGCPALVATLWDVTDKDIDRFAKSTFEHWGLFESQETGAKVKGKRKAEGSVAVEQKLSLVEAVARGREACNLRHLNAAAVCVYGVPVYFK